MITACLFLLGVSLGSAGAIFMKIGAVRLPPLTMSMGYVVAFITNVPIVVGFFCYAIPAFLWVYLLRTYPVSFVQPILALTYVLTPILAMVFLGEVVPITRWVGIVIIVVGVFAVSRT